MSDSSSNKDEDIYRMDYQNLHDGELRQDRSTLAEGHLHQNYQDKFSTSAYFALATRGIFEYTF